MLSAYPILRTDHVDEVVALIESVAGLSLRKIGRESPAETLINGLWLRRMSFCDFGYGFAASIAPAEDLSAYILSLPRCGRIAVAEGERRWAVQPGMGTMLSPGVPLAFEYPQRMRRTLMRLKVDALSHHFSLLTERSVVVPLRFNAVFGPDSASFAALQRQILVTMSRIDAGMIGPGTTEISEEVESSILTAVLYSIPHDRWGDLTAPPPAPSPRSVRRAADYIHAYADRGITLEELVAVSGVAGRTLFKHFRAFKGVGPMSYLRRVRLERAHAALLAAAPGETVAMIANRWGFHELGRFAGAYKRIFGERPSDTLRRSLQQFS